MKTKCVISGDVYEEVMTTPEKISILVEALKKIADPRLRDHQEPDKYTECGCMMNMAEEALAKVGEKW